jgi:hypothetical protein
MNRGDVVKKILAALTHVSLLHSAFSHAHYFKADALCGSFGFEF